MWSQCPMRIFSRILIEIMEVIPFDHFKIIHFLATEGKIIQQFHKKKKKNCQIINHLTPTSAPLRSSEELKIDRRSASTPPTRQQQLRPRHFCHLRIFVESRPTIWIFSGSWGIFPTFSPSLCCSGRYGCPGRVQVRASLTQVSALRPCRIGAGAA